MNVHIKRKKIKGCIACLKEATLNSSIFSIAGDRRGDQRGPIFYLNHRTLDVSCLNQNFTRFDPENYLLRKALCLLQKTFDLIY